MKIWGYKAHRAAARRQQRHIRHYRPGSPPGTLTATVDPGNGDHSSHPPARYSHIRYTDDAVLDASNDMAVADCMPSADTTRIDWFHVQGLPSAEELNTLRTAFDLHPLALEDVINRESRPKFESYEAHQFVVLNHLRRDDSGALVGEQVCFFVGANWIVSVAEGPKDVFGPVRKRIHGNGKVRRRDVSFLLHALMDLIVDSGFPLLEQFGEALENLEDDILDQPTRDVRNKIHYAKRELIQLRRAWWAQREVVAVIMRDRDEFLSQATHPYLRDCYDHCVILMDFVETYRETTASLLDTYLSSVSQRMNDVMKTLTIIATIFLPLSFIAGLYGMNFDPGSPWNMPELQWHYGYFYALGVMLVIAIGMLICFRRKRWL